MKRIVFLLLIAVFIGFVAMAIRRGDKLSRPFSSGETKKIQVTASFYPLYYFASQIGGDKIQVSNITPSGVEPHDFEPTSEDLAKIERSSLLILNGKGMEAWGEDIRKNIDQKKTLVIVAGEDIGDGGLKSENGSIIDSHVWLSPSLSKKMVDKIVQGFSKIDPKNNGYYLDNAENLKNKLSDLDAAYKQGLGECEERNIIVSHAAFGYLAAAYGLNQISIAGLSPDTEPSSRQLADVAEFAKDNNVKYIFFENLVSPKLSEVVAQEVGAKTLVLNPIEGLSSDEINQGKDYFTEMESNLINLKTALQCR
jgi:zinc transport system substrate-binding protein